MKPPSDEPVQLLLVRMSLPVLVVMLVQVGQSVADTVWLSRIDLRDGTILAGVGLVFPLGMAAYALMNGIQVGVSAMLARAVGGDDRAAPGHISSAGLRLSLGAGLAIVCVGALFGERILVAQGATGAVLRTAAEFFWYSLPGIPAVLVVGYLMGLCQGLGRFDLLVKGGALGTFANAVLDPLLIFTFDLGVRGAAIATVVAQHLVALFLLASLPRASQEHRLIPRLTVPPGVVRGVLRGGGAQALMQLCIAGSVAFYNRLVVGQDPDALAAFTLCGRIDYLITTPIFAMGVAVLTVVGQSWGAGKPERARAAWRAATWLAGGVVLALALLQIVLAPILYPLFSEVPGVVRYAVLQTRTMEVFFALIAVSVLASEAFQAVDRPDLSVLLTAVRHLLVPLPVALVAVYLLRFHVVGVYVAAISGMVVSAAITPLLVRRALAKGVASEGGDAR